MLTLKLVTLLPNITTTPVPLIYSTLLLLVEVEATTTVALVAIAETAAVV